MLLVSHDLDEAIELADKVVLLTRRPTKVAEIVDIDLPWPRNLEVTTGEGFMRPEAPLPRTLLAGGQEVTSRRKFDRRPVSAARM